MGDDPAAFRDRPGAVIGTQMGAARVAEARHRAALVDVPSPLAGVAYDGSLRGASPNTV
jgi:hypothetical protein